MNRIQRVRRSAGVLAGMAGRPCFRIAMVLLAAPLFAGTASAIAATSPARNAPVTPGWNAPVTPGWNAAAPTTALAASLSGFPGGDVAAPTALAPAALAPTVSRLGRVTPTQLMGGVTPTQVNSAMRSAMRRPRANAFGRYPRAFIEWKLSARPLIS